MTDNRTKISIKRCANISLKIRQEMFSLHAQYFENITLDKFLKDFLEKQWCIIIQDVEERIVGYSTIQLIFENNGPVPILVLFSGDTLVSKEYWNTNALVIGFSHFIEYVSRLFPNNKKYWLLLTKGYRTYRFLPLYYKEYYPACNVETPIEIKYLIDKICTDKYGGRYDIQKGLVLSKKNNDYLNLSMAKIPPGKLNDPNVRYFLNRNPNYYQGDELACLTSIDKTNIINPLFYRYVNKYNIRIDD